MKITHLLWTFQSIQSVRELKDTGILQARWERYSPSDPFRMAYQWLAEQMQIRGIHCQDCAPVWAWHSCGAIGAAPTLNDARSLLSDLELESRIQTIEFECPGELALLSRYSTWNQILDKFIDDRAETLIDIKLEQELFDAFGPWTVERESIQAALPFLKLEWVRDIRELKLQPDDLDFDPEERV